MADLKHFLEEFRRGCHLVSEFFLTVCPHVNRANVEEVCAVIPPEKQLSFRRYVAYQGPTCTYYQPGASETVTMGQPFFDGLAVLREYFAREGTLQFGDYLLMERDYLKSRIGAGEETTTPVPGSTEDDEYRRQLSLVEALLGIHPPEVLARFAADEGHVWPSVVRATVDQQSRRLPDSQARRSLWASALKPPRLHDDRWWLVYEVSPPVVFDPKANIYGFVCDDGAVKVVGDIAAIVSALETQS